MKKNCCSFRATVRRCTAYVFTWIDLPLLHRSLTLDFGLGWGVGLVNLGVILNLGFGEGTLTIALPFLDLSIGYDTPWDDE